MPHPHVGLHVGPQVASDVDVDRDQRVRHDIAAAGSAHARGGSGQHDGQRGGRGGRPAPSRSSTARSTTPSQPAGNPTIVEPFTIPGVGWGCYFTDPTGVIVGLHENNPDV
jgi:hypothetical protein